MVRDPVVAGYFYPDRESSLRDEILRMGGGSQKKRSAIGIVAPHAGYVYSGAIAGSVYGSITAKPFYTILGPNHTGLGAEFGVTRCSSWRTPLGDARVDLPLAQALVKRSAHCTFDDLSNSEEHSIEVQLPFLQQDGHDFTFLPIVIGSGDLKTYREIGRSIADVITDAHLADNATVIASSDMTHYEPRETAAKKDRHAIDAILALDEEKLLDVIARYQISMCGYAPTIIMLSCVKALGAQKGMLVKYGTSGDITGDTESVVGYAGIIII